MSKRENFYRRNPGDALSGMAGMSLEERGVYNTIIDLIYLTWRPLEDNRQYIAGHCNCAVQKVNPIVERLIARGKLLRFQEDGCWYLSNRRFEDERSEVKGASKTRSGRAGVGEKSGEVGEKSPGVGDNSALLAREDEEKPQVRPLDRVDRVEKKEANASSVAAATDSRGRRSYPDDFEAAWQAYPHTPGRSSKPDALAEWRKLPPDERSSLPSAIAGFRPRVAEVCGGKGAPCMGRWLKHGKHLNFAAAGSLFGAGRTATWGDAEWSTALRIWRETGGWGDELGSPPGQAGCRVPPHLLVTPVAGSAA